MEFVVGRGNGGILMGLYRTLVGVIVRGVIVPVGFSRDIYAAGGAIVGP